MNRHVINILKTIKGQNPPLISIIESSSIFTLICLSTVLLLSSLAFAASEFSHFRMDAILLELYNVSLRLSLTTAEKWGQNRGLKIEDCKVNVEIISLESNPMPLYEIDGYGGYADATWRNQHSAWLPVLRLKEITNNIESKYYIRRPAEPFPDFVDSEAPAVTGVEDYHNAGYDGSGVIIGIIDMGYSRLTEAESNGDAPPYPNQRIDIDYTGQGMESGTLTHGTSCMEIAYDMAPGATYILYKIANSTHLGIAVDDGIARDVNVWSHSIGWYNRGWHDDSGEPCFCANRSSRGNQIFCTSAGNRAHAHWQGDLTDIDGDNIHEWTGTDEYNRIPEIGYYISDGGTFWIAMQWNTDGDDMDNYDIYLFDDPNGTNQLASSENAGENPELIFYTNNSGASDEYWIAIEYISGDSAEFEIYSNLIHGFEYYTESSSISSPCNATGENVISSGTVDVDNFSETSPEIIFYSSQGPTNDGAIRPSIIGPTNCSTFSSGEFSGTSCAAPNVAGAAAVRWSYESNPTAASVREYILSNAMLYKDWGTEGNDNVFGHGGLYIGLIYLTYDYLPGDVNMINSLWPPMVIGGDVTYLVNYFKGSPSSQACLLDGFWCSADANGDCNVMGSDVIKMVNYFRGNVDIEFCTDYPPAWPTAGDLPGSAPNGWPNCE